MRTIRPSTVADALAAWGRHEVAGRLRDKLPAGGGDQFAPLNVVLHYRAPYVARILVRQPVHAAEVEFEPGDAGQLTLADGRRLAQWAADVRAGGGEALANFERAVAADEPPAGPVQVAGTQSGPAQVDGLVVYDGWHRLGVWYERIRQGRPSDIGGFLVVTGSADPLIKKVSSG